jgi:hypothetical protein
MAMLSANYVKTTQNSFRQTFVARYLNIWRNGVFPKPGIQILFPFLFQILSVSRLLVLSGA